MRISVCIATYNGEKFIKEQLESILKQLSSFDEVIISDDCSKDDTLSVVESIKDERIKIIKNLGDHGYTSNFENALRHASGDIIVLSDQDDVWFDNKISTILSALENYDFAVSDATIVDEHLNVINASFWSLRKPYYNAPGDFLKCSYLGCCMAFKRRVLDMALPFPSNHTLCYHDYWLLLVGAFFFKVKYIKEPLVYYRRHGNNVSDAGLSNGVPFGRKVRYRAYTLYHLTLRRLTRKK